MADGPLSVVSGQFGSVLISEFFLLCVLRVLALWPLCLKNLLTQRSRRDDTKFTRQISKKI